MLSTKKHPLKNTTKSTQNTIPSCNSYVTFVANDPERWVLRHLLELQDLRKKKHKHVLYNALLRLFRKAEIQYSSSNNTTIICHGLLHGIMLRPEGTRCKVFVVKRPFSYDYEVSYSVPVLLSKMLNHKVISQGTHDFLIETLNSK